MAYVFLLLKKSRFRVRDVFDEVKSYVTKLRKQEALPMGELPRERVRGQRLLRK